MRGSRSSSPRTRSNLHTRRALSLFGAFSAEPTDERLTELNAKVDVDGEDPANVATEFLEKAALA